MTTCQIIRRIFSGLFVAAGAWAIGFHHPYFLKTVTDFNFVPDRLLPAAAIVLPGLVVLAGGLLLAGFFVSLILRLAVGGAFVIAGVLKMWDPASFAKDVANYRMLPDLFVNMVAITLPWVEALAGALLMAGLWKKPSALLIALLMALFLAGIGQAVYRHLDIRCGCFGTIEARKVGWVVLAEDGILFLTAAWLAWSSEDNL